jgi:hypothetical protein
MAARFVRQALSGAALPCLFIALALTGCDKKDEPKDAPAAAQDAQVAPSQPDAEVRVAALAPEEPKTVLSGVPTPEDLEEEAATSLSPDNLEAELDRLEAEITGE